MSSELNTFADKPNLHGSVNWNIPKRNEATVLAEKINKHTVASKPGCEAEHPKYIDLYIYSCKKAKIVTQNSTILIFINIYDLLFFTLLTFDLSILRSCCDLS